MIWPVVRIVGVSPPLIPIPLPPLQRPDMNRVGGHRTLSVPLVDRVSSALSSVLHVSDLGEAGACDAEELRGFVSQMTLCVSNWRAT